MVRTYVKKGPKGSHDFGLTVNTIDMNKVDIGEWFSRDENISDICVAQEEHHDGLDPLTGEPIDGPVRYHHHIYLKFIEAMKLPEVQDIVNTMTDDVGYDLQVCKSRRNWLMYITKEDGNPYLKNVRVSELSLFARAQNHIKTKYKKPTKVDRADHFMVAAGNYRNVCLDMASNHIQNLREKVDQSRETMAPNMQCWLTRAIYSALVRGDHVYLYGMPGVGKSQLVDRFIHGSKVWRSGHPDRFMFSELDESVKICLFDDFQPVEHVAYLPRIQAMMDKLPVTVSAKGLPDQTRLIQAQFIFVSNENIPSAMQSLERRVSYFNVDHRMHDCIACLYS